MTLNSSSLYPVVQDLTEAEYGTSGGFCWCVGDSELSLQDILDSATAPLSIHKFMKTPVDEIELNLSGGDSTNSLEQPRLSRIIEPPRLGSFFTRSKRSRISTMELSVAPTIGTETDFDEPAPTSPPPPPPPLFDEVYVLTRQIFRCDFSEVWETVCRETGYRFCVKIIDTVKSSSSVGSQEVAALKECEMLQAAQGHDSIVKLISVFHEDYKLFLVMEYCSGGNLLTRVIQNRGLRESKVRKIAESILKGLLHLHKQGICHCNLQPSNILLDSHDCAKIVDFGSAVYTNTAFPATLVAPLSFSTLNHQNGSSSSTPMTSFAHGNFSEFYVAPELKQKALSSEAINIHSTFNPVVKVDTQADTWSLGVIMYFCLSGKTPSQRSLRRPEYVFRSMKAVPSRQCKQLIIGLMQRDPTIRLTASEALKHAWLQIDHYGTAEHATLPTVMSPLPPTSATQGCGPLWWRRVLAAFPHRQRNNVLSYPITQTLPVVHHSLSCKEATDLYRHSRVQSTGSISLASASSETAHRRHHSTGTAPNNSICGLTSPALLPLHGNTAAAVDTVSKPRLHCRHQLHPQPLAETSYNKINLASTEKVSWQQTSNRHSSTQIPLQFTRKESSLAECKALTLSGGECSHLLRETLEKKSSYGVAIRLDPDNIPSEIKKNQLSVKAPLSMGKKQSFTGSLLTEIGKPYHKSLAPSECKLSCAISPLSVEREQSFGSSPVFVTRIQSCVELPLLLNRCQSLSGSQNSFRHPLVDSPSPVS